MPLSFGSEDPDATPVRSRLHAEEFNRAARPQQPCGEGLNGGVSQRGRAEVPHGIDAEPCIEQEAWQRVWRVPGGPLQLRVPFDREGQRRLREQRGIPERTSSSAPSTSIFTRSTVPLTSSSSGATSTRATADTDA